MAKNKNSNKLNSTMKSNIFIMLGLMVVALVLAVQCVSASSTVNLNTTLSVYDVPSVHTSSWIDGGNSVTLTCAGTKTITYHVNFTDPNGPNDIADISTMRIAYAYGNKDTGYTEYQTHSATNITRQNLGDVIEFTMQFSLDYYDNAIGVPADLSQDNYMWYVVGNFTTGATIGDVNTTGISAGNYNGWGFTVNPLDCVEQDTGSLSWANKDLGTNQSSDNPINFYNKGNQKYSNIGLTFYNLVGQTTGTNVATTTFGVYNSTQTIDDMVMYPQSSSTIGSIFNLNQIGPSASTQMNFGWRVPLSLPPEQYRSSQNWNVVVSA